MNLRIADVTKAPTGRQGEMWLVETEVNNLPMYREETKKLLGQIVYREGGSQPYIIKGVETYASNLVKHTEIGLLVEAVATNPISTNL